MTLKSQGVFFDLGTREIREAELGQNKIDWTNPNHIYWIHLNAGDAALLRKVSSDLNLSANLMEDLFQSDSLPDLSVSEDELTLVTHYWEPPKGEEEPMEPRRLALHLTEHYCLSVARESIPCLERFAATYRQEFRFAQTSGFMLFLILENLVEDFAKMLHRIDDEADAVDDRLHENFFEGLNRRILRLKRQIIRLKHHVTSLRDVLMKLSGRKIRVVSESCRLSLGDVYHHAEMVVNELESQRELVASSLDAYNAAMAQKMNDTMKILTVFSAIILPLSLIAGIYGMNFKNMPELDWKYGYGGALGVMAVFGLSLVFYFKKKGWL